MASQQLLRCEYCGVRRFRTQRGLEQHQLTSTVCSRLIREQRRELHDILLPQALEAASNYERLLNDGSRHPLEPPNQDWEEQDVENGAEFLAEEDTEGNIWDDCDVVVLPKDVNSWGMCWMNPTDGLDPSRWSHQALIAYRRYVKESVKTCSDFDDNTSRLVRLCDILKKKGAPLCTTEAVMEWYLQEIGQLYGDWMRASDCGNYLSRDKMLRQLARRYNYALPQHSITPIRLPSTGTWVDIVHYEAQDLVVQLLTDPRFDDDAWLHYDGDPLKPPPEELEYLEDINTGRCYRDTYKELITKPGKQILLPLILYDDECVNGQFDKLPLQQIRMSLGILKNEVTNNIACFVWAVVTCVTASFNLCFFFSLCLRQEREREIAWRTVGYVPADSSKYYSEVEEAFARSHHAAAHHFVEAAYRDEPSQISEQWLRIMQANKLKSQDLHAILGMILSSVKKLIDEHFVWDYKYRGKIYKNVEFVPFLAYVKCDTQEADKLCGHYASRSRGVKSICRYCTCPTKSLSDHYLPARTKFKSPKMLQPLVENNKEEELKMLSQYNISNCFYDLQMGKHNEFNIHGGVPMEMLHQLLLGIFPMMRECFLNQIGTKESRSVHQINGTAVLLGRFMGRQSLRDLPKTKFSKGIAEGKLQGKEHTGVILLIAALCRMSSVREVLKKTRGRHFVSDENIDDWALLAETLLQWEAFLKLPKVSIEAVKKLRNKHRFLMALMKKVGAREKGMGMNTVKFHCILHMVDDMLDFGVCRTLDTGFQESHHKTPKALSKMTQKNAKTFEQQVAKREEEFMLIDLAMCELHGHIPWAYFHLDQVRGSILRKPAPKVGAVDWTGGTALQVFEGDDGTPTFEFVKNKDRRCHWDNEIVKYLFKVQQETGKCGVEKLPILTEHKRGNFIFRAHPNFRGKGLWNDWALFDWGNHGELACEIYCFIDLRRAPTNFQCVVDGCTIEHAVYAVVESSRWELNEDNEPNTSSELFKPLKKDIELDDDGQTIKKRIFYLAEVDSIVAPLCVIPDIGMDPSRYYSVAPQEEWSTMFLDWLNSPWSRDKEEMDSWDIPSDEELDESSEEETTESD